MSVRYIKRIVRALLNIPDTNQNIANDIVAACLDGKPNLDLARQKFIFGGVTARSDNGCENFYEADKVDALIGRLNAYIDQLREKP